MITTPFLNTNIQIITRNELLNNLTKGVLITPNVDHLVKLQKDKEFMMYTSRRNGLSVTAKSYIFSPSY